MHRFTLFLLAALCCFNVAYAETKVYDFILSWLWKAPDGFFRPVIHVNNQFPGPAIEATEGDTLIINVKNELWNEATSIHWHGLFMLGAPEQDGSPGVTQSHIPPFATFQYKFNLNQSGTYWYHSHNWYQTGDGLFGPLIIKRKNEPLASLYDEEKVFTIADWGHYTSTVLMTARQFVGFPTYYNQRQLNMWGPLINGQGNNFECDDSELAMFMGPAFPSTCNDSFPFPIWNVTPGRRYRVRLINSGIRNNLNVTIDGHKLTLLNAQGTDLEQRVVDGVVLMVAERVDVLFVANQAVGNYWMRVTTDKAYRFAELAGEGRHLGREQKQIVRYIGAPDQLPTTPLNTAPVTIDRYVNLPMASTVPKPPPVASKYVYMNITFGNDACKPNWPQGYGGINALGSPDCIGPTFAINGIPQALGNGEPLIYQVAAGNLKPAMRSGATIDVAYNQVIDIVVQNPGPISGLDHALHLHGYKFWVVDEGEGYFNPSTWQQNYNLDSAVYLDTIAFTSSKYVVLRLIGNNPGIWMIHCHMDGHNFDGLFSLINVAPELVKLSDNSQTWRTYVPPPYTQCSSTYQCSQYSDSYNYVNCINGKCTCANTFSGRAVQNDPCRCDKAGVYWANNTPYCLSVGQCVADYYGPSCNAKCKNIVNGVGTCGN